MAGRGTLQREIARPARALLRRLGLTMGRYPFYGTREAHLAHVLRVCRTTVCIDVGAHHGEFGAELRAIGYEGAIASFEPASAAFTVLEQRAMADGQWQVHRLALGSSAGVEGLNIYASTDFNSFKAMNDEGRKRTSATGSETVKVERLDRVWEHITQPADRVFLKIDTQGSDLDVLRGAGAKVARVDVLQMEAAVHALYDGSPGLSDVVEVSESLGFGLSGVFPVATTEDGTRLVEVDCLFVRATSAAVTASDAAPRSDGEEPS